METDHARMRKLLSAEKSMTNDNVEEKLKSLVFEKEEPFIVEGESSKVDNSKDHFILNLPFFEWNISEPVILKFSKEMPVNNLQEVPWNYKEPILLIEDKKCLKEEYLLLSGLRELWETPKSMFNPEPRIILHCPSFLCLKMKL